MIIKKATNKDLKEIAEIFRIETAKKPYVQEWNKITAIEKIKDCLKKDDVNVAFFKDHVVGFVTCKIDKKKKEVYVDELWLKAEYQRMGIGKAMMAFVEKKYKNMGMKKITLMANQKAGAVKFYQKLNYKEKHRFIYFVKALR